MGFLSWLMGTKKAKKALPNGRYNEINRRSRYGWQNGNYYPTARPHLPSNWWNKHRAGMERNRTAKKSANKKNKSAAAAAANE
jgi:hypothetical protein